MDTLFPFGLPFPTAFYLTLYVATLVVHVVCMNYVLAGAAYLAAVRWRRGSGDDNPAAGLLADWMPLMLSVAITAGIAPLLFLQILYRPQFYTANLLLFHRWMAILPVLIVGFYLLYLIRKPATLLRWPLLRRVLTSVVFVCFAFIGWSWTENHLLSLQSQAVWGDEYARGGLVFWTPGLAARLATWFCGSFPALAVWLLWQLRWTSDEYTRLPIERRLVTMALVALALAGLSAGLYALSLPEADRQLLSSKFAGPWLGVALAGVIVQVAGYLRLLSGSPNFGRGLPWATAGILLTTLGVAVVREALRITRVDFAALLPQHEDAFGVGGWTVFVVFLILNSVLIAWCIRLTRQRLDEAAPSPTV